MILITGANGWLGLNLVDSICNGRTTKWGQKPDEIKAFVLRGTDKNKLLKIVSEFFFENRSQKLVRSILRHEPRPTGRTVCKKTNFSIRRLVGHCSDAIRDFKFLRFLELQGVHICVGA